MTDSENAVILNKKESKKQIEDSYTSSFFNKGIKDIINISEENKDNPAKLSMDVDSYIEGNSENIPSMDVEIINKPFEEMKNGYIEQSINDLATTQIQRAEEDEIEATFEAQTVSEYLNKRNAPYQVQGIANSAFIRKLTEDVVSKRLTAEEAAKLNEINVKSQIQTLYQDILSSKDLKEEDLLRYREQILKGETGIEAIDNIPISLRKDALQKVYEQQDSIEESNEKLRARTNKAMKRYIEDTLIKLDDESISPLDKQLEINKLKRSARNKEQLDLINKWETDSWEPSQEVSLAMEEQEREGTADKRFYENLYDAGLISTKTYRDKLAKIDNFLNEAISQGEFKRYEEQLKANFSYDNLGKNLAYHHAKAAYISYLSRLKRTATPQDHDEAYKYAMEVQKYLPGGVEEEKASRYIEFGRKYNTSYDNINKIENDVSTSLYKEKQLTRVDSEEKRNTLIYGGLGTRLIKDGVVKTKAEALNLIAEYKKLKELQ